MIGQRCTQTIARRLGMSVDLIKFGLPSNPLASSHLLLGSDPTLHCSKFDFDRCLPLECLSINVCIDLMPTVVAINASLVGDPFRVMTRIGHNALRDRLRFTDDQVSGALRQDERSLHGVIALANGAPLGAFGTQRQFLNTVVKALNTHRDLIDEFVDVGGVISPPALAEPGIAERFNGQIHGRSFGHGASKPRSWSFRRSSADTSTFLGVSMNTDSPTRCISPLRP